MINLVVVLLDLRPHVLDTRVKRKAELSTDHHLVVSWLRMGEDTVVLFESTGFCASNVEAANQCGGCRLLSRRQHPNLLVDIGGMPSS